MNKLKALRATPVTFDEIEGFEISIQSMTFPETTKFAELADSKKTSEALDYLLFVTLRKGIVSKQEDSVNGMTDEEIKEEITYMDGMKAMQIVKKVQEVSGIGEDKSLKKGSDE